ncbi:Uncharacterised protein [Bordetella pertussis]|nr:Uncharacterised protein [Bordetella pertussis]CFP69613.1 Uncharacterised protein [Bordetella pertussis]CFW19646.1 Uncharacterised protein [Bordetella pertussis]
MASVSCARRAASSSRSFCLNENVYAARKAGGARRYRAVVTGTVRMSTPWFMSACSVRRRCEIRSWWGENAS